MAKAKPFKLKVHLSLRYILRIVEGEYQADCIDAAAIGLGDTQQAALQDLLTNLEVTHEFVSETENVTMLTTAGEEEETLYAKLKAGKSVDPSVLGYGVVQLVELVTASGRRKSKASAHFEIGSHTSLAA